MKSPTLSIAIADDNDAIRNAIAKLLQAQDYYIAASVADGSLLIKELEKLSEPPHLCIVDVNMPTDGYKTTETIKKKWPATKVIAFTLNNDSACREKMRHAGADEFCVKGSDPLKLLATINGLFSNYFTIIRWEDDGIVCKRLA